MKNNPKTMRFEPDIEDYINKQPGKNFSDKFHNLVKKFKETENEKNQTIKHLDNEILLRKNKILELNKILSNTTQLHKLHNDLTNYLTYYKKNIHSILSKT